MLDWLFLTICYIGNFLIRFSGGFKWWIVCLFKYVFLFLLLFLIFHVQLWQPGWVIFIFIHSRLSGWPKISCHFYFALSSFLLIFFVNFFEFSLRYQWLNNFLWSIIFFNLSFLILSFLWINFAKVEFTHWKCAWLTWTVLFCRCW